MSPIIPPWLRPSKAPTAPAVSLGYWVVVAVVALPVVGRTAWAEAARAGLGVLAIGAIVVGVLRHAPTRRWPWFAIATAVAIDASGGADHLWPALWMLWFLALGSGLLRLRRLDGDGPATE